MSGRDVEERRGVQKSGGACFLKRLRSVVDDDGPSHPQAGVGVRGGQHQPLRLALGNPAQADLLTRLSTGVPQLGAGQHPAGPPGEAGQTHFKTFKTSDVTFPEFDVNVKDRGLFGRRSRR